MTVNDLSLVPPPEVLDPQRVPRARRTKTIDLTEPRAAGGSEVLVPPAPDGQAAASDEPAVTPADAGSAGSAGGREPAPRPSDPPMQDRHRSVSRRILAGEAPALADLAGLDRPPTVIPPAPVWQPTRDLGGLSAAGGSAGVAPPPIRLGYRRGRVWLLYGLAALLVVIAIVITVLQLTSAATTTGAGNLEPTASAYLDFARSGTIEDVLVKPGDYVRAGEVLAEQDTTAAEAQLSADQATLDADRARVLELGTGSASSTAAVNALLAQANQELDTAQSKASASLSSAQNAATAASSRLQSAQQVLTSDEAQYATSVTACNAAGRTSASQPTNAQCVQIQTALSNDTSAVSNASAAVSQAQLALKAAQTTSSQQLALANSRALLAAAKQGQAATSTATTSAADAAAANAAVARDIAAVAADEATIDEAAITSPVAGIVGSVGAQAGDFATPDGVRTFQASGGSGSSSNGFTLFAPPAESTTGGSSSGGSGLSPVVIVYGTAMQVSAEFSEHTITKIHTGEAATVTIPALGNRSVAAVVADINPTAVTRGGRVSYVVDLNLTQTGLTGAMPGMTVNVSFPRG